MYINFHSNKKKLSIALCFGNSFSFRFCILDFGNLRELGNIRELENIREPEHSDDPLCFQNAPYVSKILEKILEHFWKHKGHGTVIDNLSQLVRQ